MSRKPEDQEDEGNTEFEDAFNEFSEPQDPPTEFEEEPQDPPEDAIGEPGEIQDPEPGPEPEDEYAGMSDEAKERYKALQESNAKMQHRIDSDNGRVSSFQKKINALERAQAANNGAGNQPSQEDMASALAGGDESWNEFKEEYPEVADAFDKRLSAVMGSQEEKINNALAPVIEKQTEDAATESIDKVAQEFPNWQDAVKEKDFDEWMVKQPAAIQSLAASDEAYDAISLIDNYNNHRIANNLPSLKKNDHAPDDMSGVDSSNSESLEQKRNRQLDGGTTIPSRPARIDPSAESGSDFDNAFAVYAAQKDQKRQA